MRLLVRLCQAYCTLFVRYCHDVTGGKWKRLQLWRSTGRSVV